MMTVWLCIGVAVLAFLFGVAGLYLGKLLPEPHSVDLSRDMIGAIVGLVSLLLALVLGTLIGSSYSFYATQKSELEMLAAREVQLDLALSEFGPETKEARAAMKQTLEGIRAMLWGDGGVDSASEISGEAPVEHLRALDLYIASLDPKTPAQRQFVAAASANAGAIEQTRVLISMQLASSISWPLVIIVVSWALILFCGFGLLSRITGTTLAALGFGAFAVGSALFMVLELSHPFSGVFRVPSAAVDQMLELIGR
jgi:Protein of unknown function (DUF4239)